MTDLEDKARKNWISQRKTEINAGECVF